MRCDAKKTCAVVWKMSFSFDSKLTAPVKRQLPRIEKRVNAFDATVLASDSMTFLRTDVRRRWSRGSVTMVCLNSHRLTPTHTKPTLDSMRRSNWLRPSRCQCSGISDTTISISTNANNLFRNYKMTAGCSIPESERAFSVRCWGEGHSVAFGSGSLLTLSPSACQSTLRCNLCIDLFVFSSLIADVHLSLCEQTTHNTQAFYLLWKTIRFNYTRWQLTHSLLSLLWPRRYTIGKETIWNATMTRIVRTEFERKIYLRSQQQAQGFCEKFDSRCTIVRCNVTMLLVPFQRIVRFSPSSSME